MVLGLSHEPRRRIRRELARRPVPYELLQCTGRTAIRYGADAVPTVVLIDRDGVVRSVFQGSGRSTVEALRRAVGALLG